MLGMVSRFHATGGPAGTAILEFLQSLCRFIEVLYLHLAVSCSLSAVARIFHSVHLYET